MSVEGQSLVASAAVTQQRYVSRELTHFVGAALPSNEERYALLVKILQEGWLTHPPHNLVFSGNLSINPQARISSNEMYEPQVVCFCDIPVIDLDIHVQKYGLFGIAYPKSFLIEQGANPVFYVAKPSRIHSPFTSDLIAEVMRDPAYDRDKMREALEQKIGRGAAFDRAVPEWHRMVELLRILLMDRRATPGVPPEAQQLHGLTLFMEFQIFSFIKFFDPAWTTPTARTSTWSESGASLAMSSSPWATSPASSCQKTSAAGCVRTCRRTRARSLFSADAAAVRTVWGGPAAPWFDQRLPRVSGRLRSSVTPNAALEGATLERLTLADC